MQMSIIPVKKHLAPASQEQNVLSKQFSSRNITFAEPWPS